MMYHIYQGVQRDGKTVAIKKLEISETMEARSSFETEVMLIGNTYYRNLVGLLACCRKGPDLLLVYEYMEKSSLDRYLFVEYVSISSCLIEIQLFNQVKPE